jgi:hypothetical protein
MVGWRVASRKNRTESYLLTSRLLSKSKFGRPLLIECCARQHLVKGEEEYEKRRHQRRSQHLQDLEETARFRLRLDVGLRTKLNDFLSFRVGLSDTYDNRPRPNVKKNEVSFTTGLGFVF